MLLPHHPETPGDAQLGWILWENLDNHSLYSQYVYVAARYPTRASPEDSGRCPARLDFVGDSLYSEYVYDVAARYVIVFGKIYNAYQ